MKLTSTIAILVALSADTLSNPLPYDIKKAARLALRDSSSTSPRFDILQTRAICTEEELEQLVEDTEDDTGPAPASGGDAGLGAEFESSSVQIEAEAGCSFEDKNKAKGKIINGRKGTNWQLTADLASYIHAEYQIIGTSAKIGKNLAVPAAEAIAADVVAWDPRVGDEIDVEDNPCRWTVKTVALPVPEWKWAPQLTVPMPLEAINDIIAKSVAGQDSPFLGNIKSPNWVSVTKDFFQSKPSGIEPDAVSENVLGFVSLLVSYAKVAKAMAESETLHHLLPIMPRTDFVGQYDQVSSELPNVDLYELVNILACYTNRASSIDTNFCTGELGSPSPNGQMDQQNFVVSTSDEEYKELKVKDWINALQGDSPVDGLVDLDKFVGGSFGAFGKTVEKMVGSDRLVPIFEFRRLQGIVKDEMRKWTEDRENAVLEYYKTYASASSKKLKKRQDCEVGMLKKMCRIEAGVVDKPVDHDKPYLTMTFFNENWDQVGDWAEYLGVNENSGGIGSLGPLIYATMQDSTGSEFPFDVAFEYDDQRFNFLNNCTLMSDSNLGQGQTMESRRCEFECRG